MECSGWNVDLLVGRPGEASSFHLHWVTSLYPGLLQLCPEELDQTHPLGLELKLNQVAIPA